MSHELDFSKGFAAIAVGAGTDTPWHGLVNDYIQPGDSVDTIAKKSGLDWGIQKAPVEYTVNHVVKNFENKSVLYRDDTGAALSVMSESHYIPAQPRELIEGLLELTKGSGFVVDCVMALRGGKVISALARREAEPGQLGADITLPYLGILTSCDGTFARQASMTAIRRVCMNTVRFSLSSSETKTVKQRNSSEFTIERANDLFDKLGEYDAAFAEYMNTMRAMTQVKMSDDLRTRFFAKLYAPEVFDNEDLWNKKGCKMDWDKTTIKNGKQKNVISTNAKNVIADLLNFASDSPGASLPSADGTLYGAFNAITYFTDHKARTKGDKRWESASLGNGATMKTKALELASSLI